jgi:glycosyltransferase involved in cell wall biosynthesis
MHVLHAYKVSHTEIYGGIPEAIRILASTRRPDITSAILAARLFGRGYRQDSERLPIQFTGSFGTLASTPLAPSYPFALARAARRADVVALHVPFPLNDIGIWLGLPQRAALVVHWHAEIVGRRLLSQSITGLLHRTLSRADCIVVSSEKLFDDSPILAPYRDKCSVVPFGVDTAFWGTLDASARVEAERLAATHPRLVLAVGRLVPYKGFDVLIEAIRQIDATAIIVGDGAQAESLRRLTELHGVSDRVLFAGNVSREKLRTLLHAARVFAFPSLTRAETFGIAQLEAMAAGLPIVNTALPTGVPTVARDGIEALTVGPGDPTRLAEAIGRLLDTPELAASLGHAARRRAAVEFDQAPFIDRMHAIYAEAIRSRRIPASNWAARDRRAADYRGRTSRAPTMPG